MSALTDERREELRDYIRGLRDAVDSEDWISEPEKHLLIYADLLALLSAPPQVVSRWHLHQWATGFDEDIAHNEKNLRDIFHDLGIEVKE